MAPIPLVSMAVFLVVFLAISGLGVLIYWKLYGDQVRALSRLRTLADNSPPQEESHKFRDLARSALPELGKLLVPRKESHLADIKDRLWQAGLYQPQALRMFLGAKLVLLLVFPVLIGLVPGACGFFSLGQAIGMAVAGGALGLFLPDAWLQRQIRRRQRDLRRGLPDALDMLVLCLEGGVSLMAATQRVTEEVQPVHPVLGEELAILQGEIQFGLSVGEALKKLGQRSGLEDVRDLASVLLQFERFGASMVKALRTYADSWRFDRQQRAEEMAQKASVKILFPTLLCIFPAIFIVLLGPAAMQISKLFAK